jgi:ribosomal peptide maturation radical SAM protein 1
VSGRRKALIVVMPLLAPEFPALGATLIRTILKRSKTETDILYAHLLFAKHVGGSSRVENILSDLPIGQLIFSPYYFSISAPEAAEVLASVLAGQDTSHRREVLLRCEELISAAGACLDELVRKTPWGEYDVVGFSVLESQIAPSLALAKRVRQLRPSITIIFGGAQTQGSMGEELLRSFKEIDYVVQGEADATVVPLISAVRSGAAPQSFPPGVLYRDQAGHVSSTGNTEPFNDLDGLPVPDYSEYFTQLDRSGIAVEPYMTFETSRGCWWGQKHHCTFCSFHDDVLTFRTKSVARVVAEMLELMNRHRYTELCAVDSILSMSAFSDLLPFLGELRRRFALDFNLFFEIKANIRREQARGLRAANVNRVQPGIESFSDHILKLMEKGSTAARQLQCLRLLVEQDIEPLWNWLFGTPGETVEDYDALLEIIPFLHHLPPLEKHSFNRVQFLRFSPQVDKPAQHGVENLRAWSHYSSIYKGQSADFARLGLLFDGDVNVSCTPALSERYALLGAKIADWRRCYVAEALTQARGPGFVKVVDRRSQSSAEGLSGTERVYILEGLAGEVLNRCVEVTSLGALEREFGARWTGADIGLVVAALLRFRFIYVSPSNEAIALPLLRETSGAVWSVSSLNREWRRREGIGAAATTVVKINERGLCIPSALEQEDDCRIPVAVEGVGRSVSDVANQLLEVSRRTRSLLFDLGRVDGEEGLDASWFKEFVQWLEKQSVEFEFVCELGRIPTNREATLLREAGIVSAELSDALCASSDCALSAVLTQLGAVRTLDAAGIVAKWRLTARAEFLDGLGRVRLNEIADAARHLPPPEIAAQASPQGVTAACVRAWRENYEPRTLTYARGPKFMRVCDRRDNESKTWRYVVLGDWEERVLRRCFRPRTVEVLRRVTGTAQVALAGFLDNMVAQKIMCRGMQNEYLALPVRRSISDKWMGQA